MKSELAGTWLISLVVTAVDRNRFEVIFTVRFHHRRIEFDLDVRRLLQLVDQVLRHRSCERWATHQHHHSSRILREVHRRLSGAIRAADDEYVFVFARHRFGHRCAVINSGAGKTFDAGRIQLAPLHAGRNQQRVTTEFCSVGKFQKAVWTLES